MARTRYLKPDYFMDEDLADLDFKYRHGFQGLWVHADRAGRLEDRPKKLKALIFPYDDVDMDEVLETLSRHIKRSGIPFIIRYSVNGRNYIQILCFEKHQMVHKQEQDSKFPSISSEDIPNIVGTYPEEARIKLEGTLTLTLNLNFNGERELGTGTGTGMGTGERGNSTGADAASGVPEAPDTAAPVRGKRGKIEIVDPPGNATPEELKAAIKKNQIFKAT